MKFTSNENDMLLAAKREEEAIFLERLKWLFGEIDADGSGQVTELEFADALDNEKVVEVFTLLNIEAEQLEKLFAMVAGADGTVEIDEFIEGCSRMSGEAK